MSFNIADLSKYYESGEFEKLLTLLDTELSDAHLLSLRGITKKALGQIEPAILDLEESVNLAPGDTHLLTNLGNAYREAGRLLNAEVSYTSAIEADPANSNAHDALGLLLFDTGDFSRASFHFKKCIELENNNEKAWYQLGEAYRKVGELGEAIKCYKETNYHLSKSNLLECFYRLEEQPSIDSFRNILTNSQADSHRNALSGSIVSHAEEFFDTELDNPFCQNPLSLVATGNIKEEEMSDSDFLSLMEFIDTEFTEYRTQSLLVNGRQSSGNLFSSNHYLIKNLNTIIHSYIDRYRKMLDPESNFARHWPAKTRLYGWVVDIRKNGKLDPHIHKEGWVSGCFYLHMPEKKDPREGAIAFTVEDSQYPELKVQTKPKTVPTHRRMICMFPSSLHHYTKPFSSDGRRVSFAFDLLPA